MYAQIGIEEYWQFDPKGEWISEQLRGFRLVDGQYVPILNSGSTALGLRLEVTGALISFYRSDNGEKLLIPFELQEKARQLEIQLTQSEAKVESLQAQLDRYRDRFGEL